MQGLSSAARSVFRYPANSLTSSPKQKFICRMKVQFAYGSSFLEAFGDDRFHRLDGIESHVKTLLGHSSLGTKMTVTFSDPVHVDDMSEDTAQGCGRAGYSDLGLR